MKCFNINLGLFIKAYLLILEPCFDEIKRKDARHADDPCDATVYDLGQEGKLTRRTYRNICKTAAWSRHLLKLIIFKWNIFWLNLRNRFGQAMEDFKWLMRSRFSCFDRTALHAMWNWKRPVSVFSFFFWKNYFLRAVHGERRWLDVNCIQVVKHRSKFKWCFKPERDGRTCRLQYEL